MKSSTVQHAYNKHTYNIQIFPCFFSILIIYACYRMQE